MKLEYEDYLSAKISYGTLLTIFPQGKPEEYLKDSQEKRGGESVATKNVYDFPDDFVVIARTESGGAVVMPDEPLDISIEVHIGKDALPETIETAEQAAKEMAAEAGINTEVQQDDSFDFPRFGIVRH